MVISDRIVVEITSGPGDSFLDRMIALVEGAIRQRTPNEIALTLVLSAFTLVFLIVVVPLWPMAWNAEQYMMGYLGVSEPLKSLGTDIPTLIALIVCLIPTTIGALPAWTAPCRPTSSPRAARRWSCAATSTSSSWTRQAPSP
jgi:K+-transporting ATPase ATPase B chain